jgi:hypothetical protein
MRSTHRGEAVAVVACAVGGALVLLLGARRRRARAVLYADAAGFARAASEQIALRGFAIFRLQPADADLAVRLFGDADDFFDSPALKRRSYVAPKELDRTDRRSGYINERGREYFELHPRVQPSAPAAQKVALLRSSSAFCAACHELCAAVLRELAASHASIDTLLGAEARDAELHSRRSFDASMLRVHR